MEVSQLVRCGCLQRGGRSLERDWTEDRKAGLLVKRGIEEGEFQALMSHPARGLYEALYLGKFELEFPSLGSSA